MDSVWPWWNRDRIASLTALCETSTDFRDTLNSFTVDTSANIFYISSSGVTQRSPATATDTTKKTSMDKPHQRSRPGSNAARERSRVKTLKMAFLDLQRTLPAVPRDTKLSKLDVLVLATTYIAHLTRALAVTAPCVDCSDGYCHHDTQCKNCGSVPDNQARCCCSKAPGKGAGCVGKLSQRGIGRLGSGRNGGGVFIGQGCYNGRVTKASTASNSTRTDGYLHPVKKWPMRTRLYAGIMASACDVTRSSLNTSHDIIGAARAASHTNHDATKAWDL
ncbi:hypothetical protein BaRGS_00016796 [Batillaria attramentaria]|uniref:BHLH domain-containing protein n=1 Tax=Batillaria attramentaria TaxID=370345 RepID=A0ABD0KYP4_9CAEN